GLLVWAEVPVISRFSEAKQENAKSQLIELIEQNINHASIYAWGIQNEITIGGKTKGVEVALNELNRLSKSLDPSRPTVSAQVMMYDTKGPLNKITDILGYNIYYGWYMRTAEEIGGWLDDFHKTNPEVKLCLSEYGAEGILRYQNDKGVQGDYSETYQAYFHEVYAREIEKRDWLWGSYVWNMFDFGAANRDEGGVKARNNKGLMTIDRKVRKDSFYVYKAYWSDKPFVHIGGERYAQRPVGKTNFAVYSNQPKVSLNVNGETYEKDCNRVVRFEDVEIKTGENIIKAVAGAQSHEIKIEGVTAPNPDYVLPKGTFSMVRNWFVEEGEGVEYFTVNDRVGSILKNEEIKGLLSSEMAQQAIGSKKKLVNLVLTLIKPFKVKTLLKIAPLEQGMKDAAVSFITTLKK
ncbi:MAG TPA: glycoside hydrolase family 2 TIM barrel-domain containing protein, partial [Clostridiales bacterium]|nr:glycoside hydrolase family 2 TIM barrel-domain containing protein [Clostridiales bacterium]